MFRCTLTAMQEVEIDKVKWPICQDSYWESPRIQAIIERDLTNWLAKGVIKPSKSPWSSNICLRPLKNTKGEVQLCADYRHLSKIIKKPNYPMPSVETRLSSLNGADYYSFLELNYGCLQIKMDEESIPMTAFSVTQNRKYEFLRMPYGLPNQEVTFQRCMDKILKDFMYNCCLVDSGGVLVFAKTEDDHTASVEKVIKAIQGSGLIIDLSGCYFRYPHVKILGHLVSEDCFEISPKRIKAIECIPRPVNAKELKSFIGKVAYYKRFIEDFSKLVKPLKRLTKEEEEGTPFIWTDDQQRAFEALKKKVASKPMLTKYEPKKKVEKEKLEKKPAGETSRQDSELMLLSTSEAGPSSQTDILASVFNDISFDKS